MRFLWLPRNRRTVFPNRAVGGPVVQTIKKGIESREVGHASESERLTEFAVLAQQYPGFATCLRPLELSRSAAGAWMTRMKKSTKTGLKRQNQTQASPPPECASGFPLLHEITLLGMWDALEVAIHDLIVVAFISTSRHD